MNIKHYVSLSILILILPVSVFSFDFGLTANVFGAYGNIGTEEDEFEFRTDIVPRISFLIGDKAEFFMSAGVSLGVSGDFYCVPEIMRTEFSLRFGSAGLKAGRIAYSDPLSFIASGLFDGLQFAYNSAAGSFGIGALYTGLQYKKSANITMTPGDQFIYDSPLDYGKFAESYFAPSRIIAFAGWDHPSIGELLRLNAAVIAQFDLTDDERFEGYNFKDKYDSQYIILKAGVPVKSFLFELGGSLEISQIEFDEEKENFIAFAADAGIFWTLPTPFNSRLSFNFLMAGGRTEDSDIGAFVPVSAKYYGGIFKQKMSALSVLSLGYTARIINALGASLTASHFLRNDLGTYRGYPIPPDTKSDGYSLGTEFFARIVWSPISDLQLNLGGGAFIPKLGNASPGEDPWWRVEMTVVLAVF